MPRPKDWRGDESYSAEDRVALIADALDQSGMIEAIMAQREGITNIKRI